MRWFGSNSARDVRGPARGMAEAFAERALIVSQMLSLDPKLSDIQVAVLWAACAISMRKVVITEESTALLNDVACDFFDTFCQDYVSVFAKSPLKLDLSSTFIIERVTPTLEVMHPDYLEKTTGLFIDLSANAAKLAERTIEIIGMSMSSKEKAIASRHTAAFIDTQKLGPFEKIKAQEWLLSFWSTK